MNVIVYQMVKAAMFDAPACPDGSRGMACVSCMAESVTHMLEDEYTLTPKWHSVTLDEV